MAFGRMWSSAIIARTLFEIGIRCAWAGTDQAKWECIEEGWTREDGNLVKELQKDSQFMKDAGVTQAAVDAFCRRAEACKKAPTFETLLKLVIGPQMTRMYFFYRSLSQFVHVNNHTLRKVPVVESARHALVVAIWGTAGVIIAAKAVMGSDAKQQEIQYAASLLPHIDEASFQGVC